MCALRGLLHASTLQAITAYCCVHSYGQMTCTDIKFIAVASSAIEGTSEAAAIDKTMKDVSCSLTIAIPALQLK